MNLDQLFEDFVRAGLYLKGWSPRTPPVYRRAWVSYTRFQQSLRGAQRAGIGPAAVSAHRADFGSPDILTKAQLEAWVISRREAGMRPAGDVPPS
jgi:hypothetical protein